MHILNQYSGVDQIPDESLSASSSIEGSGPEKGRVSYSDFVPHSTRNS